MIISNCLSAIFFWSLYGPDGCGCWAETDIDCGIIGQDRQERIRLRFVDAKNYRSGALPRIATSLRRGYCVAAPADMLSRTADRRLDLYPSANMDRQGTNQASLFNGRKGRYSMCDTGGTGGTCEHCRIGLDAERSAWLVGYALRGSRGARS